VLKNDIAFYHGPQELVWICGNLDSGCVEVYSSFLQSKSDVIFSPLIGNLIDIISENNPEQILSNIEEELHKIYLLASLMTEIMTTPATILSIDKLCQILGNNTVVLNEIIHNFKPNYKKSV